MSFNSKKVLGHRVVILGGTEEFLVRQALVELIQEAGLEKDDYDLETMSGDGNPVHNWLASAGTAPFLAPRRVVVVRQTLKAKLEELTDASLKALPETALLILVLDEESGETRPTGGAKKRQLEKTVTAAGGIVVSFAADPKKTKEQIRAMIVSKGKNIAPNALETLVEMTGGSLSRAMEEVEKLILFSRSEAISDHDVRSTVVASREWNIWRMIDAMTQGDVGESLRQLRIVVASKGKVEDVAFSQLFPLVARQLRLLMQGRLCLDAGCQPQSAPDEVRANFPSKPNLASESPYRQNSVMRSARNLSLDQITKAMTIVCDADARLKGLEASFSGMDTVERLVFELSATLKPKTAH
jgi:DNA polymerase III subunit delta